MTFENDHRVLVCDLAIAQVREAVGAIFGDVVQLTPASGQGTRVEIPPTVDGQAFQVVARAAIAAAQQKDATQHQSSFQPLDSTDDRRVYFVVDTVIPLGG